MSDVVLAVDGGNSKTDVALVAEDGGVLGAVRGESVSHQAVGPERGMERLASLVAAVHAAAGMPGPALRGSRHLLPGRRGHAARSTMARQALEDRGFAAETIVRNDALAALRAGTDRGWGVVVICGSGVNAAGVAPDGRAARLAALGPISGDWGGGMDVGWAGLAAAVRARDGRGPATRLARDVPRWFGLPTPAALTLALYRGRIDERRIGELSPLVFVAAGAGDVVARAIVDPWPTRSWPWQGPWCGVCT